jgi:hypothetical protein
MSEIDRPLCAKCGVQPRLRHDHLCASCREAPRLANLAYLDAVWRETQAYKRPVPPAPPPVSPGRPSTPCPRCGPGGHWLDLSGLWHCACGFAPENPDGGRRLDVLYATSEPVAPGPDPATHCQVCGPTTWQDREDGSQQCPGCGAVRACS